MPAPLFRDLIDGRCRSDIYREIRADIGITYVEIIAYEFWKRYPDYCHALRTKTKWGHVYKSDYDCILGEFKANPVDGHVESLC